jgi:integrase
VEQEQRILAAAPPYLRVGTVLLVQTGGRTYSEGFSLSKLACDVLRAWVKEQRDSSPFLFPSPVVPDRPISTLKKAWRATLKRAGVPYFAIYNLRHVFCTRLSWVAPDGLVQRAMRHSGPETKQQYQLGLAEQVREHIEKANEKAYQGRKLLHFRDSSLPNEDTQIAEVCN